MSRALLVAALLVLPLGAAQAPRPAGCRVENALDVCQWTVDTSKDATMAFGWDVPVSARTLAQLTLVFEGQDAGWEARLFRDGRYVSGATHTAATGLEPNARVTQTTDHLLLDNGTGAWRLVLVPSYASVGGLSVTGVAGGAPTGRSLGTFSVTFVGEPLPPGEKPARPAASLDVPHLQDPPYDAPQEATDLVAAWLDDAAVGDGLLDAHVVTRGMERLDFRGGNDLRLGLDFTVREKDYFLVWKFSQFQGDVRTFCWMGERRDGTFAITMNPACSWDRANASVTAVFPERSVGSPGPGEPFTSLAAWGTNLDTSVTASMEDSAQGERFPFAMGGPAVWDDLNGCAFCPPPVERAAFYEDPLAADNLADTLQVLGAALAVITFVFGFVALRRTRRQTKMLLLRVDALVAQHERDAREALLALGRLEAEFARLYRDGRINETQYQVATQRLVAAASRMALRRELGLDDGAPDAAVRV